MVAKGHNKGSDNPSTEVSEVIQKKVSCTSSNGPPRSYYGALKMNLKTCAKGTKLRVYTPLSLRIPHFLLPPFDLISSQCHLIHLHSTPRPAHLTSKSRILSPLVSQTRGALPHPLSPSRTPRQRASSTWVPRDSPSQAMEAP